MIVVFASCLACYKFGFEKGYSSYRTSQKVRFVMSLSELQNLRNNDLRSVMDHLEKACYSSALFVLKDPKNDSDPVIRAYLQQLIDYRRNYAKRESEWSVVEQELAKQLEMFRQRANQNKTVR